MSRSEISSLAKLANVMSVQGHTHVVITIYVILPFNTGCLTCGIPSINATLNEKSDTKHHHNNQYNIKGKEKERTLLASGPGLFL